MIKSFVVLLGLLVLLGCSVALPASNFIVGGTDAYIEEIPFQVAIFYNGRLSCGASILDNTTLLSAAHCFDLDFDEGRPISLWSARVGSSLFPYGGTLVQFESIKRHPQYNKDWINFDVAIVKLSSTLVFSDFIQPVKLPPPFAAVHPGQRYQVSGWGTVRENGAHPVQLQKLIVPALSHIHCQSIYAKISVISPAMFCAGDLNGLEDSCQGDSGGPLVSLDDDPVQFGIISWGEGCAKKGFAGVYTNVPFVRSWILQNMK